VLGSQRIRHQGALYSAWLKVTRMVLSCPLTWTRSVLWQRMLFNKHKNFVFSAPKSCSVNWVSLSTSSHWRLQLRSLRFEAFKSITLTKAFLAYQPRQSWVEIQHFGDLPRPLAQGRCLNHEDGDGNSLQGSAYDSAMKQMKAQVGIKNLHLHLS